MPSPADLLDRMLDELVAQEELEQRRSADHGAESTVMVDPAMVLDDPRPIVCRPQPLHLARGTTPPPIHGAYCLVDQTSEVDERDVIDDEVDQGS